MGPLFSWDKKTKKQKNTETGHNVSQPSSAGLSEFCNDWHVVPELHWEMYHLGVSTQSLPHCTEFPGRRHRGPPAHLRWQSHPRAPSISSPLSSHWPCASGRVPEKANHTNTTQESAGANTPFGLLQHRSEWDLLNQPLPHSREQLSLKRVPCLISCCTTLWKPLHSSRENQATGTDSNFSALVPPLAKARAKECEECGSSQTSATTGQGAALIRKRPAAGHFLGIKPSDSGA